MGKRGPKPKPLVDRFWAKVDKNGPVPAHRTDLGPCWLWTASFSSKGYGKIGVAVGGWDFAHRIAFLLTHGRMPEPCALHHCDNRACVRPGHIFEGTKGDNAADRDAKGRTTKGERSGVAKLTEAQVREIRARHAAGQGRPVQGRLPAH